MSGIFISYRREDSAGWTGRLYDHLITVWGQDQVFFDIDAIEPGEDFRKAISNTLSRADVVLVIIGPRWVSARGDDGLRRLDDEGDLHRKEVESALIADIRVVPVLVGGARMPKAGELPASLTELVYRNNWVLDDRRFKDDLRALQSHLMHFAEQVATAAPATAAKLERSLVAAGSAASDVLVLLQQVESKLEGTARTATARAVEKLHSKIVIVVVLSEHVREARGSELLDAVTRDRDDLTIVMLGREIESHQLADADAIVLIADSLDGIGDLLDVVRAALDTEPTGPVAVWPVTIRSLDDATALARSTIAHVEQLLVERHDAVRVSAALTLLRSVLNELPGNEAVAIANDVEEVEIAHPQLAELNLLRDDVAGRLKLPQNLAGELRTLLLELDPRRRLALDTGASPVDVRKAAEAAGSRWRALLESGRVPYSAREAVRVATLSIDRLWSEAD